MTIINDVRTAFKEGEGQWTGCAWPTRFGALGLDLDRVSSHQAHTTAARWLAMAKDEIADDEVTSEEEVSLCAMAEHLQRGRRAAYRAENSPSRPSVGGQDARLFCSEVLAREWEYAALWLEEIEADAAWAEEKARQAVGAAERGQWNAALWHSCHACQIESGYNDCRPWSHLKEVIEEAGW